MPDRAIETVSGVIQILETSEYKLFQISCCCTFAVTSQGLGKVCAIRRNIVDQQGSPIKNTVQGIRLLRCGPSCRIWSDDLREDRLSMVMPPAGQLLIF